jgi:hypothetical protein
VVKERKMNLRRFTSTFGLPVAVAALVLGGSAVVALAEGTGPTKSAGAAAAANGSITGVVSSLGRPVNGADVLGANLVASFNQFAQEQGHAGIDWNNARQLVPGVWVVGSGSTVCLHVGTATEGSASCESVDFLAAGRPFYVTGQGAGVDPFTIGIVPDGVAQVSFHLTDGTSQTVPVVNNAFKLAAKAPADRVGDAGPAGSVTEALPATSLKDG